MDMDTFKTGLHRLADGFYAYMQPDGSWGLNNMGVVIGKGRSLLIDATTDVPRMRLMLAELARAEPANARIDTVVLTHWHLDHVWGASVFPDNQKIVASRTTARLLRENPTQKIYDYLMSFSGDARKMLDHHLGAKFDFSGLKDVFVSDEFEGRHSFDFDGNTIDIIETRPAHSLSDSVVFIRDKGIVHIGDVIAGDRHLGLQHAHLAHLQETCDLLIGLDARLYVPGHGPNLDLADIKRWKAYVEFIGDRIKQSFQAGRSKDEAYADLLNNLGPYRSLSGPARLYQTIVMVYAELEGRDEFLWRDLEANYGLMWRKTRELPEKFPALSF